MKEVLDKIKPSQLEKENFKKLVDSFIRKLNSKLKEASAVLGGSGSKQTWLSGSHDIDIFILFPYKKYKDDSSELSNILEPSLTKAFPGFKINRLKGSRDYFQLDYHNFRFEVVPILNISKASQAQNITDVSPLHTKWVNKKAAKIKDEIMLAKQFCKANRLYGAESYIGGFSGYVLEILVAQYGSFSNLLKAAIKWKVNEVIDIEKHYPKNNALTELNKSKLTSPIIVIDPVDKSRNAAAALTMDKFLLLKKVAAEYLNNQQEDWFVKEDVNFKILKNLAKKEALNLIYLTASAKKNKEDVMGMKLLKSYLLINQKLELFSISKSGWEWDKKGLAQFYYLVKKKELEKEEVKIGPPLKLEIYVKQFKKKYKGTFIKDERIMAKVKRKNPRINDFMNYVLKQPYLKERIKIINFKVM